MKFEKTDIYTDLDPRLQQLVEQEERGLTAEPTASTEIGEVAVIAKVSDLEAWDNANGVRTIANIGSTPDGYHLVTARIPIARLEEIRRASYVFSLKPGVPLKPNLEATLEEIRSRKDLLPSSSIGNLGEGVVIGIVDYGCDFVHKNFRHDDGSTRLIAIWDQGGTNSATSPFGYGREYSREEINQVLQSSTSDPYEELGYNIPTDQVMRTRGTHGTHVMDIAAGNTGVAPKADLVFVEIRASQPIKPDDIIQTNFGNSIQLLEAIRYIFDKAKNRACVINFSLGTNGGPHDGSNLAEQGIDLMLSQQFNRAAVIAAGNSFENGIHAAGRVTQGGWVDLQWMLSEFDSTENEIEIWYKAGNQFRLEVISPNGSTVASLDLGENGRLKNEQGEVAMFLTHRKQDPNNGDNVISLFCSPRLGIPSGVWMIRLHGIQITDGSFHAWIERDDFGQSKFAPPHDNTHTLGSLSCGKKAIVVGSYDAHKPDTPLSFFSSSGPTRDGRQKPEISAPGHEVLAAHSRSGFGRTRKSGTSMAAPAVTGVIALLLAEAKAKGVNLNVDEIRDILIKTARKTTPDHVDGWHPRFGHGRVDAASCVLAVQQGTEILETKSMQDPSLPGKLKSRVVVYATPGLNYSTSNFLGSYFIFEKPTQKFETRAIDLSEIADFDANYEWPFSNTNTPINGLLHIPDGTGPFPLALFAHGNHDASENSTPGYLYLCELLASHGILAATIDVNFLNGSNSGENDGRAIVQLEHIKQFKIWNETSGHPLLGRVDLSKVMIAGHSRGGEAVGHASIFNRMQVVQFDSGSPTKSLDGSEGLGPYQFSIQAIVAISPTDQQYTPVNGLTVVKDNYFVLHGSRDGDVFTFNGHLTYDRCHRVNLANPVQETEGFKSLLWVHGANHNYFNSEWGQESAGTVTRADQEKLAKIFIGAIAQAQLLGRKEYIEVLMYPNLALKNNWLTKPIPLVTQYQGPKRLLIQHLEEKGTDIKLAAPFEGTVSSTGVVVQKRNFSALGGSRSPRGIDGGTFDSNHHLFQDTQGVRIDWTSTGGNYSITWNSNSPKIDKFTYFSFRVGQSFEPNNIVGAIQDFTIILKDNLGSVNLAVSELSQLIYPDEFPRFRPQRSIPRFGLYPPRTEPVTVLQTILVPLQLLKDKNLNISQLQGIEFRFDRTSSGTIYLDDIQFMDIKI
ncbi:S8 family serine peptidase [Leptolyngbya sp. FACHB-16]|uniref:S8 family serine peptidase n=1 Tax=unclassified Leptolyngbya TaxID=2650499 RepID=UPI00168370B6|nr:S8 family serine peptidase [Leptolyngbya sp. FACHB-16]MBD2156726.1 S8 family serine peptidase [Leptolyngbya sp. FACHB-16]